LLTSPPANANKNFLFVAKQCHDYLVDNHFTYQKGQRDYPIDVATVQKIDCSAYVSWVIYEYQQGNFSCQPSRWYLKTAKKLYHGIESDNPEYTHGWKAIRDFDELKPGDILCYYGHVQIYMGIDPFNEKRCLVLNAGSNSALSEYSESVKRSYIMNAEYAIRLP